jgi:hypothetical protein
MTVHETAIAVLLIAAIALNLSRISALFLVFLTSTVLLILPKILPDPNILGESWYWMLMGIEGLFAVLAWSTGEQAGKVVAGFSFWNTLGHILGLIAFHKDLSFYSYYSAIIRTGEISQAAATVLFSTPVINLAVIHRLAKKGGDDARDRLEYVSG